MMATAPPTVSIEVEGLRVVLEAGPAVVEDVAFAVAPGELLALVGESGAGKTTLSLALLGYARRGVRIAGGAVRVDGSDLLARPAAQLASMRGAVVSYVPQNPSAALDPSMRVGDQVREVLEVHGRERADATVAALFERVALPAARSFRRRFPHQLSGGQQQRVAIAMALACRPRLVVLDEPTTALDVITQARILELVRQLRDDGESAFVYVTHDVAAVAEVATAIAVLYAGRLVEHGPRDEILRRGRHPYTRALVRAVPRIRPGQSLVGLAGVAPSAGTRPSGCVFAPRCELAEARCRAQDPALERITSDHVVRCLRWRDVAPARPATAPVRTVPTATDGDALTVESLGAAYRGGAAVLSDVSFTVAAGECLAVVGESGSGKTTLARCIVGLHAPSGGRITLDAEMLASQARARTRTQRRLVQLVFQNPDESLNPRVRVRDIVARPAQQLLGHSRRDALARADELLGQVRLDAGLGDRLPGQLSGGERQRVSIARALAAEPSVLVCDEITSALDVSVQAAIIELISDLRRALGLAVVFVSHDLAVVSAVADRVLVLERGIVRELGDVKSVVERPTHPYTRALVDAAPDLPYDPSVP